MYNYLAIPCDSTKNVSMAQGWAALVPPSQCLHEFVQGLRFGVLLGKTALGSLIQQLAAGVTNASTDVLMRPVLCLCRAAPAPGVTTAPTATPCLSTG